MVPFLYYFFSHFAQSRYYRFQSHFLHQYRLASKIQKGAKFLGGLTPLNPLGGYKKIGNRGFNFEGFRGVSMVTTGNIVHIRIAGQP